MIKIKSKIGNGWFDKSFDILASRYTPFPFEGLGNTLE